MKATTTSFPDFYEKHACSNSPAHILRTTTMLMFLSADTVPYYQHGTAPCCTLTYFFSFSPNSFPYWRSQALMPFFSKGALDETNRITCLG